MPLDLHTPRLVCNAFMLRMEPSLCSPGHGACVAVQRQTASCRFGASDRYRNIRQDVHLRTDRKWRSTAISF
ncbi:hypothetical protein BD414DRAFT_501520 [Trametes punicea]|nr:hypothetical protein BD414DRAFT_501520 [Trametes punicea]